MSSGGIDEFPTPMFDWEDEQKYLEIKTPNALSDGEKQRLIEARIKKSQQAKARVLNDMVFEMFDDRDHYTEWTGSIVSFLHLFNRVRKCDVFVEPDAEHYRVLCDEFKDIGCPYK